MTERAPKIDLIKDAQHLIKLAHIEEWHGNHIPILNGKTLEEEGGITQISTKNLAAVFAAFGYPIAAEVASQGNVLFYFLPDQPKHLYRLPTPYFATGFTVGYRGEGPSGLARSLTDFWKLDYMKTQDFVASISKDYRGVIMGHCWACR